MYSNYCKLRDSKGYKDAHVAKATGITKSTFSDWKNGRSEPKREKLQKIADFFEVSLDLLIGNEKEVKKPLNNDFAKGNQIITNALKDTGLLNNDEELTVEGAKVISEFIEKNADMLKQLIQVEENKKENG